jgi:hypothetical protein
VLNFRESWERTKADCPGIDQGKRYDRDEIEALLDIQCEEKTLTRKVLTMRRW